MSALGKMTGDTRRCVFCGKYMAAHLTQCPFCREAVPQVQLSRRAGPNGREQIRRGLLYILLGGVIHYFAGGDGQPPQVPLPATGPPPLNQYPTPPPFLSGLGGGLYRLLL